MIDIRKGQAPAALSRHAFGERYRAGFVDPAFAVESAATARLEDIAWQAYHEGRKAPMTRLAGPGYADPAYGLSVDWLDTRRAIDQAQLAWHNPATPSRVLLVCGSARNDGTCPGEISKTWRLTEIAQQVVEGAGVRADVSVAEAKRIEEKGWGYPKHLAGRAFGVVVHGDAAGAEEHRRNLCDWLEGIGLIDAGAAAKLDRYIGYYEPYYNSHEALDRDGAVQEEVRNVARSVVEAVRELRAGSLSQPDRATQSPRPK